jgi:hypothetical protein
MTDIEINDVICVAQVAIVPSGLSLCFSAATLILRMLRERR